MNSKITPFLWFDNNLEEALQYYKSIFKNVKLGDIRRYPEGSPGGMAGKAMGGTFEIEGQRFMALNGGPQYKFTEAISFFVDCDTQEEVDYLWDKLTAEGEEGMCGWLKDKYGLSWQIIPKKLGQFLGDSDPEKAGRVMQAMMQMKKIDSQKLQDAYDGK